LIGGGLFHIWKSTIVIHHAIVGSSERPQAGGGCVGAVIRQIRVIDLVFSLDSIITAVGMVDRIEVMIAAVIASVALMMLFAKPIGDFVSRHPTVKMLALSFLVVVGLVLLAEGFDHHVPQGYVFVAMAFSVVVELLNIRLRSRAPKKH
ncbi:MAG: TerC family protein, partial [Betaproteobacteria bacterium]